MRHLVRAAARARPVLLGPLPGRWNREHAGDLAAGASALAVVDHRDDRRHATAVPGRSSGTSRAAFTVISEAVWWVTIVDATLVRHHPTAYDSVMAGQAPAQRELVEGTLAGLRFVRNRIGGEADLAEIIEPSQASRARRGGRVTGWTWRPVPEPTLALAAVTQASVGEGTTPRVPGAASRSRDRRDLRPRCGIPHARRGERPGHHRCQRPGRALTPRSAEACQSSGWLTARAG